MSQTQLWGPDMWQAIHTMEHRSANGLYDTQFPSDCASLYPSSLDEFLHPSESWSNQLNEKSKLQREFDIETYFDGTERMPEYLELDFAALYPSIIVNQDLQSINEPRNVAPQAVVVKVDPHPIHPQSQKLEHKAREKPINKKPNVSHTQKPSRRTRQNHNNSRGK